MNKKIGKIVLCTALALTTPFALIGCSKKAANTDNNNTDNTEIQQPVVQQPVLRYAKDITWPYTTFTQTFFENDDQIRAVLIGMMSEIEYMSEPVEPTAPDITEPVEPEEVQEGEDGYEEYQQAYAEYEQQLAAYESAMDTYNAQVEQYEENYAQYLIFKQAYPIALTNLVNKYIKDTDNASVNETVSSKTVYKVPATCIENFEQGKTLAQYYAEFDTAYDAKYNSDADWVSIMSDEDYTANYGPYRYVKADRTEDILIATDYDSASETFTIYELSFSKGGISAAFEAIMEEMETEMPRIIAELQQANA